MYKTETHSFLRIFCRPLMKYWLLIYRFQFNRFNLPAIVLEMETKLFPWRYAEWKYDNFFHEKFLSCIDKGQNVKTINLYWNYSCGGWLPSWLACMTDCMQSNWVNSINIPSNVRRQSYNNNIMVITHYDCHETFK